METSDMSESIPIPSGYNVYWEKWVDAYETDIEIVEEDKAFDEEESEFGISFESMEEQEEIHQSIRSVKTIFTPFGVLPLTEHSLASNYFKFWVGHTNFKITKPFHNIISNIQGVETLDIFTPYRFRISVGKLFRDRDVMGNIKNAMVSYVKGELDGGFKSERA
tara:strand:- start:7705 stop:8196 length:492 start_codon:yes stop_codon:yes gene_type:complete